MKKVLIGLGVVILLIAGAAVFLLGSLDSIVQQAIEEVGTQTTKTEVKVASVKIELGDAKGALSGLSVANPAGFSSNKALSLGQISLKLDANSITSDPIIIKEVKINNPSVSYELGKDGNNFDVIKKNVAGASGSSSSSSGNSPKIIIENLYINDGKVAVTSALTGGKPLSANLPNIHLKDIGKEKGGATPEEVAKQILSSITNRIGATVGKLDLSQLKGVETAIKEKVNTDKIKEELGGAGDKLKGLFK